MPSRSPDGPLARLISSSMQCSSRSHSTACGTPQTAATSRNSRCPVHSRTRGPSSPGKSSVATSICTCVSVKSRGSQQSTSPSSSRGHIIHSSIHTPVFTRGGALPSRHPAVFRRQTRSLHSRHLSTAAATSSSESTADSASDRSTTTAGAIRVGL